MTDPGGSRETGSLGTAIERVVRTHDALRRENLAAVDPRQVAFEQAVMGLLATLVTRTPEREQAAERRRCAAIVRARVEAPLGLSNARAELTDVLAAIESEPPAGPGDAALPRTPEVVLRAMLRAYEAAALDAARVYQRSPVDAEGEERAYRAAVERVDDVREGLAECLEDDDVVFVCESVGLDYEARLAGTRPLDALPPEAP